MRLVPEEPLAAVCIKSEAEGLSFPAKVGVAEAIRNRIQNRYFSDGTVAGTVFYPLQFSAMDARSQADQRNRIRAFKADDSAPADMDCVKAWAAAQAGSDNVKGAMLFYSVQPGKPPPYWAVDSKFVCQIDTMRFYRA